MQQTAAAVEEMTRRLVAETKLSSTDLRFAVSTPRLVDRASGILDKEPDMIAWINSFPLNAVFWDVGANIGVFALYAAVTRQAYALAFEPSALNFEVLARNIELNNLSNQVTAYCIAFCDRTRLGTLNLSSSAAGSAMNQFGNMGERSPFLEGSSASSHGMIGFTIDEFIETFRPAFPTHLKIDVDGLELAILDGAQNTLNDHRLRSVMIELTLSNEPERGRGIDVLENAGLRCVSQGDIQGTVKDFASNHLFVRDC